MSDSARVARSVNPHSLAVLSERPFLDAAGREAAVAGAAEGWRGWAGLTVAERLAGVGRVAAGLRAQRSALAALITAEVGKPIAEAEAEVDKCAATLQWVAENSEQWLIPEEIPARARRSEVHRRPAGLVLAILPWNYPLWQAVRVFAGAWPGGNGVLLKHAPTTLGCSAALCALVAEAGLPPGALTELPIHQDDVAALIADPRVRAVTLTGSEGAGRAVGAQAGANLKPCTLELGGSDAFIVMADADLPRAAAVAARARLQNNGQTCIAAKRFFIENSVLDDFLDAFLAELRAVVVGDPADRQSTLGPLHRADLVQGLHQQVQASLRRRQAQLLLGGAPLVGPAHPGHYYPPTVILDANEGSPVACTETFGPLAAVWGVHSAEEAVLRANDSRYGLAATLFGADLDRARHLALQLDCGGVFINEAPYSDARLPFGGVKASGLGRELGREGTLGLLDTRTLTFA